MRAFRYVMLAGLLGAAVSAQAAPATYEMDPTHTMVIFSWNHLGFSNPVADIGISKGTIVFDKANPSASSVEVTMPLELLDTHVKLLDEHLKKAPFFDAAKNPDITFKSTSVTAGAAGHYTVVGNLTANGVTKPVTLDAVLNGEGVNMMSKKQTIGFDANATLNRSDFGVGAYVPKVSDKITIHITTEAEVGAAK